MGNFHWTLCGDWGSNNISVGSPLITIGFIVFRLMLRATFNKFMTPFLKII